MLIKFYLFLEVIEVYESILLLVFSFYFSMVWSLCSSVDEEGRRKLDTFVRGMEGAWPLKDTIYEYYVDVKARVFASWDQKVVTDWKLNKE